MNPKNWTQSAVLVATAAVLSACGTATTPLQGTDGPGAAEAPSQTAAEGCQHVSVSRVKSYESLTELATDSPLIVTGRVLPGTKQLTVGQTVGASGLTFDLVPIEVTSAISGRSPDQLTVRVASSSCSDSNLPAPLEEGATYALFLRPFELEAGKPTGEWVMTTDASVYKQVDGAKGFTLLTKEKGADALPGTLEGTAELMRSVGMADNG